MAFDWDTSKAAANKRKHGITFEEASTIFNDPNMKFRFDGEHSNGEDRYVAIGLSEKGRLLIVAHVYRGDGIRIISARKVSPAQENDYA